jgi:hypothetical protein
MIVLNDPKTKLEMQLHEQYAINSNAILGTMLTLFVALLAVIGAYGYVFLHTGNLMCIKSDTEFSFAGLIYTAIAAILVLSIIAWFSIIVGYRQRKEQFVTDAIRKQHYTIDEYNKIYPKGYEPTNKGGVINPMQFPYDTFFGISIITMIIIILSLIIKAVPVFYCCCCEMVVPVFCLAITILIVPICITLKISAKNRSYKNLESEYNKTSHFKS